ncbi:MAG: LruC domain-containing protein, partial [Bacteroidales bacterium]|nr:LruC domain-containing protein [Bacteroidales bacterium]
MKRKFEKSGWSGLCLAAVVLLAGCQNDNLFDSKFTPNAYEQSFVVKNVSPDMDWKTTSKATVSVTVDEDNEVLYKVQIFDENPLIAAANAKLLTSGFAKTNQKFETEIDYPTALNTVFVCRIDEKGRRIVRPVVINNGVIA